MNLKGKTWAFSRVGWPLQANFLPMPKKEETHQLK
jgi:hypothetical protein